MSKAAETAKRRRVRYGREGRGNRSERRDGGAGHPSTVPAFPFPEVPDLAPPIFADLPGAFEGKPVLGGFFQGRGRTRAGEDNRSEPRAGPLGGTLPPQAP